jgi:tetratricopeptide (TPR) repeat protein
MILRLSNSFSRVLVVVASLFLAAGMSYFAVRMALGAFAADGQTGEQLRAATRWEPQNPEYWYRLGHFQQFNLEEADSALAVVSLQKSVELNPQYTDAWLDLATTDELEGDLSGAQLAYARAKRSYPASADVSWRYGNFLLRSGDLPSAFSELHRAIQADPKRAAAAFSRAYHADPDIDEILEKLLPPIPSAYIDVLAETTASQQLVLAQMVWIRLLALHPDLQIRDFDPLVSALILNKDYATARRVWNQGTATMSLSPLLQPPGTLVWDPSFESGINGFTLSWRFRSLEQGVRISFDSSEKLSGNQSLRLSFDGKQNPALDAACAETFVDPGATYRFSGWVKTRKLTTEQGISFRLRSFGDHDPSFVTTREFHGTMPWTLVDMPWTAGDDVHRVEICVGRDPSDNPDVRISGNAWVDDVNLVPESPERGKP